MRDRDAGGGEGAGEAIPARGAGEANLVCLPTCTGACTWHCMYVCSIYNCPLPTDTSFVRTRNESIDTVFNPKP